MFYSKVNDQSVNAFIKLGDETINSSLIETGRSLLDPQPHPSCTSSPNETDVHECLSSGRQKYGCQKGKDLVCTEDIKVFPAMSLKLITHQIGTTMALLCKMMITSYIIPGRFDFMTRLNTLRATKTRTTPLCSSLLVSISNAGRTHVILRSPPEE